MNMHSTVAIGCDLGDRNSHLCVLNPDGIIAAELVCPTTRTGFRKALSRFEGARFILEAGTHSPWVSELVAELGHQVIVANPRKVALIAKNRNKSDCTDAAFLARLGRFDPQLVFPIQHRGSCARADLACIRSRAALVRARSLLVNHVRSVVKTNGERLQNCTTSAFSSKARGQLPEHLREALEPLLDQIASLTQKINELKRIIETELPERYPEILRVRQVPGVGPITAATFVLTLEDPKRFSRNRKAAAFLGLTPARDQTGNSDPELGISKAGDRMLRSLLVECAQFILRSRSPDSDLKRWGLALASRGRKAAKKRAVVATARKLSVLLCSLWRSGETYEPLGYRPRARAA